MKRNLIVTLSLVALITLTVSASFAQDRVKADVPFSFQVGKAQLPAGTYTVKLVADHAVAIQSRDGDSAALTNYSSDSKLKPSAPKMVFHRYGNSYFLAEIWDADGTSGMKIPETKLEKELQATNWGPASEELVVVAMK